MLPTNACPSDSPGHVCWLVCFYNICIESYPHLTPFHADIGDLVRFARCEYGRRQETGRVKTPSKQQCARKLTNINDFEVSRYRQQSRQSPPMRKDCSIKNRPVRPQCDRGCGLYLSCVHQVCKWHALGPACAVQWFPTRSLCFREVSDLLHTLLRTNRPDFVWSRLDPMRAVKQTIVQREIATLSIVALNTRRTSCPRLCRKRATIHQEHSGSCGSCGLNAVSQERLTVLISACSCRAFGRNRGHRAESPGLARGTQLFCKQFLETPDATFVSACLRESGIQFSVLVVR